MAVKTITIKEDAYKVLAGMKKADESFSDVILRIGTEKSFTAKNLYGKLKMTDAEFKKLTENAKKLRDDMNKEMEARHNVFTRHFGDV
jgi:predicted CopG family antitoxin